jgi:hypothetical protein
MSWPRVLTIGSFGERMDLRIKQGSSFGPMRFEMVNPDDTPVDLSNCEIRSQIRQKALDATVIVDIQCDLSNPMLGKFEISLTDEQTRLIEAGESINEIDSRYVWDMELEDGSGRVIPLYHGNVVVLREVTR